jgi:chromosome segregation ATPase
MSSVKRSCKAETDRSTEKDVELSKLRAELRAHSEQLTQATDKISELESETSKLVKQEKGLRDALEQKEKENQSAREARDREADDSIMERDAALASLFELYEVCCDVDRSKAHGVKPGVLAEQARKCVEDHKKEIGTLKKQLQMLEEIVNEMESVKASLARATDHNALLQEKTKKLVEDNTIIDGKLLENMSKCDKLQKDLDSERQAKKAAEKSLGELRIYSISVDEQVTHQMHIPSQSILMTYSPNSHLAHTHPVFDADLFCLGCFRLRVPWRRKKI